MDPAILSALTRPGNLDLPSHRAWLPDLTAAGCRAVRQPSGHLVLYGPHGRRILATDPDGNPLHECEWTAGVGGTIALARARLHLDWGQWIGLKPQGLVNRTTLDLSRKPGWQRLRADDLRQMASHAMGVPLDEVRFFYGDDDLVIDARGQATICHAKDAFYVLEDGRFDAPPGRVRFMACMGAMHWASIDFLPVVELFQSLLPGTGSAALEMIRGLYDDQNVSRSPRALRYRGIPPYPSDAAYRLFGVFFTPSVPGGGDPFPLFMDTARAHEVTWLPAPDPPRRFFDPTRRACVTIQGGVVQKVTLADDAAGVPFVHAGPGGFAPCGRQVSTGGGRLRLHDGAGTTEWPIPVSWGATKESTGPAGPPPTPGWRDLFDGGAPAVPPCEAFGAVLLYPEDGIEIAEEATQPFVADYLQDEAEHAPDLAAALARSERVLIQGFDAAFLACIGLDRPRDYVLVYERPALAQKQAQMLWNQLARTQRSEWVRRIRFRSGRHHAGGVSQGPYDLIYLWVPYDEWERFTVLQGRASELAGLLRPGGLALVAGPRVLGAALQAAGLRVLGAEEVEALPTLRMHRTILPQSRVKPDLVLFRVRRG